MSTLDAQPKHRALFNTLLIANLVIMLFPPIHLLMANGNMNLALTYFLGAPTVLVASMFVLGWLDGTKEAEDF
jgi:hypothetical protein